jgi:hypothetical protein
MRARLISTFAACFVAGCGGKAIESASAPDSSVDASPSFDASTTSTPDASSTGTPDATIDSATDIPDAGPPPPVIDGCVDIVLSTYDQSCQKSSDCIGITAGEVCTGGCACGGAVINVSEEARYNQAIAGIQSEGCPCPPPGMPTCVQGTCTTCTPGFCQ